MKMTENTLGIRAERTEWCERHGHRGHARAVGNRLLLCIGGISQAAHTQKKARTLHGLNGTTSKCTRTKPEAGAVCARARSHEHKKATTTASHPRARAHTQKVVDILRVRLKIIRNAHIKNVVKSESCMVYKSRIIFKRTRSIYLVQSMKVH